MTVCVRAGRSGQTPVNGKHARLIVRTNYKTVTKIQVLIDSGLKVSVECWETGGGASAAVPPLLHINLHWATRKNSYPSRVEAEIKGECDELVEFICAGRNTILSERSLQLIPDDTIEAGVTNVWGGEKGGAYLLKMTSSPCQSHPHLHSITLPPATTK